MKRGVIKRGFILASLLGLSLVNLLGSSLLIYQQGAAAMGKGARLLPWLMTLRLFSIMPLACLFFQELNFREKRR